MATISAKSEGNSEVSISGCFGDFGVNWGVNCCFAVSQVFVISGVRFLGERAVNPFA